MLLCCRRLWRCGVACWVSRVVAQFSTVGGRMMLWVFFLAAFHLGALSPTVHPGGTPRRVFCAASGCGRALRCGPLSLWASLVLIKHALHRSTRLWGDRIPPGNMPPRGPPRRVEPLRPSNPERQSGAGAEEGAYLWVARGEASHPTRGTLGRGRRRWSGQLSTNNKRRFHAHATAGPGGHTPAGLRSRSISPALLRSHICRFLPGG